MATIKKRVGASKMASKSNVFNSERVNPFTRYTLIFDDFTGENLFYEKTHTTGFYIISQDNYLAALNLIKNNEKKGGDNPDLPLINYKSLFREVLKRSRLIDLFDDNLGPLIRIIFGEGIDGNEVDKRIVAESVYNRFQRRQDLGLTLVGKVADNYRQVIEAGNGTQYNAIKEVKKKEGNYTVYRDFYKWFDWMCQNLYYEMNKESTKYRIIDCFKIAIQILAGSYNTIGHGVTHYYMSLDLNLDKSDGLYFEKKYPNFTHLIKNERDASLILGYSKYMRDACKKP